MKLEISGSTGSENRVVRVTVGNQSIMMSHGDFSQLLASPQPLMAYDVLKNASALGKVVKVGE